MILIDIPARDPEESHDLTHTPVSEAEFAAWRRMTPEQQALFDNQLSNSFRRRLAERGDGFHAWIAKVAELARLVDT
jgi:hypothetical protein